MQPINIKVKIQVIEQVFNTLWDKDGKISSNLRFQFSNHVGSKYWNFFWDRTGLLVKNQIRDQLKEEGEINGSNRRQINESKS